MNDHKQFKWAVTRLQAYLVGTGGEHMIKQIQVKDNLPDQEAALQWIEKHGDPTLRYTTTPYIPEKR